MNDPLIIRIDVEQRDAELLAVFLQGLNLLCGDGIKNRSSPWFGRDITGMVFINHPTWTRADLPFGGVKMSGYGHELAGFGIQEFVNKKLINVVPIDAPA